MNFILLYPLLIVKLHLIKHEINNFNLKYMKGQKMPIVNIDFLEGRTLEQKKEMAKRITEIISEVAEVAPEVVWIKFNEMKKENFSTGGKLKSDN